ncbi:hypothetical protein J2Y41_004608 [Arthrobacter sp. 1088]|nr:hypothetical protein [Arthrobacter sp. 1088]
MGEGILTALITALFLVVAAALMFLLSRVRDSLEWLPLAGKPLHSRLPGMERVKTLQEAHCRRRHDLLDDRHERTGQW